MAEMNAMWQKASEEMYKNAGAQGGPQGAGFDPNNMGGNPNAGQQNNNKGGDDEVTDVDFEEVK